MISTYVKTEGPFKELEGVNFSHFMNLNIYKLKKPPSLPAV
jgi:hypothetical protein